MEKVWVIAAWILLVQLLAGCVPIQPHPPAADSTLQGTLVVFHAGSLTMPVELLTRAFNARYPRVTFATEAAGSLVSARKVSELGRQADLVISADYTVIDRLLIPAFADWNIQFARNSMVIAYTDRSRYADEINAQNWYEILTREGVIYGHSDPQADPCGYRALLVWQLAELHYQQPGLYTRLREHCPPSHIRPKETDLIPLLQSGDMDYAFQYRSVAVQHGLKFLELPDEINLSRPELADFYRRATVDIAGAETQVGMPIIYGVTIPRNAPRPDLAVRFLAFLLGPEGQAIMEEAGQPPIVPALSEQADLVPGELRSLVIPAAGGK
ncbi:MAG: tungstate ABC transporter substrate-binding protein WtpA [Anaerolineae bacterium]|nr:tungstate ABC transporter substrate-binding protein WtpA [Anaerolineae bacterium]